MVHDQTLGASVARDGRLPALTGLRDARGKSRKQDKKPEDQKGRSGGGASGVQGTSGSAGGAVRGDPLSPVASATDARERVVQSARRLLGVVRSFDERSFLGHVLIINDVLPRGESSIRYTASAHRERARKAGSWSQVEQARPGDVVVFPCRSGCGIGADDGVAAGVVEEFGGGTLRFIAYLDGEVRRCVWGKDGEGARVARVDGVVRTWP